jgi:toxin ParE1/3/4
MPHTVFLTEDAARDLQVLDDYIATNDSPKKADYVLGSIEEAIKSLAEMPERGSYPKELSGLGIREYREIYFKPYRIIYRTIDQYVYIFLIADGRRDLQDLLQRRMLSEQ